MEIQSLIYITGFMGAGKSTIGSILANALGWEFFDLDRLIESKRQKTINNIFKEEGEKKFREIETEMLIEISKKKLSIVSLGGGAIASEKNLKILKSTGTIVYLASSLESVYARLRFKRDRPILKLDETGEIISKENFVEKVKELFESRKPFYEQADIKIDTDSASVGQTVDRLVRTIERQNQKQKNEKSKN
ncbi:MAG: shikimate kinase [Ignavibacteriaceae bacterium]|nr:shikimate kinase [Ignavibacteriaceae bacterium]